MGSRDIAPTWVPVRVTGYLELATSQMLSWFLGSCCKAPPPESRMDPVAEMGQYEGQDHRDCVMDKAVSSDCLNIERGCSARCSE